MLQDEQVIRSLANMLAPSLVKAVYTPEIFTQAFRYKLSRGITETQKLDRPPASAMRCNMYIHKGQLAELGLQAVFDDNGDESRSSTLRHRSRQRRNEWLISLFLSRCSGYRGRQLCLRRDRNYCQPIASQGQRPGVC